MRKERAMSKIGYARVSTDVQSLEIQFEKLNDCKKIFSEKKSGTSDKRPALTECLNYLREGDVLVVTRLDRLARSTLHLCQIGDLLKKKGVGLIVLEQNINTETSSGRLLFNMLGTIGQFELEIRAERQAEGIAKAKARGAYKGRNKALTDDEEKELKQKRDEGFTIPQIMKMFGISKATTYRILRK